MKTKMIMILKWVVCVLLILMPAPLLAQEAVDQEEPAPTSVDEVITPMDRSFKERVLPTGILPWTREQLKDTPPFFRDTKIDLNLRTYYRTLHKYDDTVSEAWALGGALSYRSGWFLERIGLGAVLYTSQPVYAPDNRDGTGLLKSGQEGYTVVGQAYARVRLHESHFLNLYRYQYNTPYLNSSDSRMTPKTFEGYAIQGAFGDQEGPVRLRYGAGYITKIRDRTSYDFEWMSRAAGAKVKRGVTAGGCNFSYQRFSIGAIDYYSDDIINIGYAESRYTLDVTDRFGILFAVQFTDQRSVGSNFLTNSSFSTNQAGIMMDVGYGGGMVTLGYTKNSKKADLLSPWGSYPGFTSVQVTDYNLAGEHAFLAKASYDFSRLGLPGVAAYALFVHGWGRVNPSTRESIPDENEVDGDLQWRPEWRGFRGLWFRTRYAVVHQYEGPKNYLHDFRIIVNYDIPLL